MIKCDKSNKNSLNGNKVKKLKLICEKLNTSKSYINRQ